MFSGAMDILVIESPNGTYKSSAFHVRFGSFKIIRTKEKEVEIFVNNQKKDVKMKLSSSGDAYFPNDELLNKQKSLCDNNMNINMKLDEIDPDISKQKSLCENNININIKLDEPQDNKKKKLDNEELMVKYYDLYKEKYKAFFPSSNQLKQLDLEKGRNDICFVCKSSFSGIKTIQASIYLWPSTSKIIISDVDGTITKSDVLGQVLPFLGGDWAHEGVTELFTSITKRGYNILYLTARAIGQSSMTKKYLDSLIQEKHSLPPGPLFLSPDGVFTSLKREVIERNPHLLKIPLLTELKNLFPEGSKPFFAGFGNRETDAVAYRWLEIPLNNIFLINTSSTLLRLGETKKTSYKLLTNNLDEAFPFVGNQNEY